MGFMVAMAWAGTRLEEGNLNMVRDMATLYIFVNITCLKILTPYRQFPFKTTIKYIKCILDYKFYNEINLLLLRARSAILTLPCCLMNLATDSSSSWLM